MNLADMSTIILKLKQDLNEKTKLPVNIYETDSLVGSAPELKIQYKGVLMSEVRKSNFCQFTDKSIFTK